MRFTLDTDICAGLLRDDPRVFQESLRYAGQIALSTVVVGELLVVTKKTARRIQEVESGTAATIS